MSELEKVNPCSRFSEWLKEVNKNTPTGPITAEMVFDAGWNAARSNREEESVEPEFRIGDIVQLNSGSPWMTVRDRDYLKVYCTWFNEATGRMENDTFHSETIHLIKARLK